MLFYAAVQVGFSALSYTVSEGAGSVELTISRIGASSIPVTLSLIIQNGTALGMDIICASSNQKCICRLRSI